MTLSAQIDYQQEEYGPNQSIDYNDFLIQHRIACENYPYSEALYSSIEDWEKRTGKNWPKYCWDYITKGIKL